MSLAGGWGWDWGDLMSDDVLEAGLGPGACTVRSNACREQTDMSENITFPTTSWQAVTKRFPYVTKSTY